MPNDLAMRLSGAIRENGPMPFVDFCRAALYDPQGGYYAANRTRVGAEAGTDFLTNLAVKSVFAPLVVEAVARLCDGDAGDYRFVEIGAEPGSSLLEGSEHPFGSVDVVRLGDPLPTPTGPTVVFANEWLDAFPFVRMRYCGGRWLESMVGPDENRKFAEKFAEPTSADARELSRALPPEAPEGYRLDLSLECLRALRRVVTGSWKGLFLTFDYGSSWESLVRHLPGGTARSYRSHRSGGDLLAEPGSQDLTCNVCWDRVATVLEAEGFAVEGPERQEVFLMKHAADGIRAIIESPPSHEDDHRARLRQLLNPVHFGAAFQVLRGVRR